MKRSMTGRFVWAVLAATLAVPCGAHAAPPDNASYRAGIGLLNKGMHDLAVAELRTYLNDHPDGQDAPNARYALAVCLVRLERHAEAAPLLDQVIGVKGFEFEPDARLLRAECDLVSGNDGAAAKALAEILESHSDFAQADRATALYGESLYRLGDLERAHDALASVVTKWPQSPSAERSELFCALTEARLGNAHGAADRAKALRERFPQGAYRANAALVEAQCRHRMNDLKSTGALYELAATSSDPSVQSEASLGRAQVARAMGRPDDATKLLKELVAGSGPVSVIAAARLEQGRVLFDQGRAEEALREFERLAKDAPADLADDAAYWTGKCLLKLGRHDEAAGALAASAATYSKSELAPDMLFDRAVALTRAGKDAEAQNAWHEWRAMFKGHELEPEAIAAEAACMHRLGKYDDSLALCSEFARTTPDHPRGASVELLIAENEYFAGRYDRAETAYRAFIERHADDPGAWRASIRRGLCLVRLDRGKDAEKALGAAVARERTRSGPDQDPELRAAALSALGEGCLATHDWPGAERWFGMLVSAASDERVKSDAMFRQGLSIQRQGRHAEALPLLEQAARAAPDTLSGVHARFECGQALVELGKLDEARACFESVLEREKIAKEAVLTPHCLRHLASIASKQGRPDDAAALLGSLAESASNSTESTAALMQEASAWMASGKFDRAEQAYSKVTEADSSPSALEARARRAVAISRQGRYPEALAELDALGEQLSKLDAECVAAVRYERALDLRSLGRDDQAAVAYRELLGAPLPDSLAAFGALDLAQIESQAERFDEAMTLLDRCRGASKGLAPADTARIEERETYLRGLCLLKLGKAAEAAALLRPYREKHGAGELAAPMGLVLGDALLQAGRPQEAAAELARVVDSKPAPETAPVALLKLGDARVAAQQWPAAEEAYSAFLDRFADSPLWFQARFGEGWCREQQGRHDGAIEAYRDVVERHQGPTAARAQFQIGECAYAQKQHEKAVGELLKVDVLYAYPEWSAAALYEAGRCLGEMGRTADAARQFDDVIKRFPDSSWARLARERAEAAKPAPLPGRAAKAGGRG